MTFERRRLSINKRKKNFSRTEVRCLRSVDAMNEGMQWGWSIWTIETLPNGLFLRSPTVLPNLTVGWVCRIDHVANMADGYPARSETLVQRGMAPSRKTNTMQFTEGLTARALLLSFFLPPCMSGSSRVRERRDWRKNKWTEERKEEVGRTVNFSILPKAELVWTWTAVSL